MLMAAARFSGHGAPTELDRLDIGPLQDGRLAGHWYVIEDEVTRAASVSGLRCLAIVFLTSDECDGIRGVKRGSRNIHEPE